jgi:hypothetical protein
MRRNPATDPAGDLANQWFVSPDHLVAALEILALETLTLEVLTLEVFGNDRAVTYQGRYRAWMLLDGVALLTVPCAGRGMAVRVGITREGELGHG